MTAINDNYYPDDAPTAEADGEDSDTDGLDGAEEGGLVVDNKDRVVRITPCDRSLPDFYRWKQEGSLIVDPEWQRKYVWDRRRASKLTTNCPCAILKS